jgi:hypothetical protein
MRCQHASTRTGPESKKLRYRLTWPENAATYTQRVLNSPFSGARDQLSSIFS